MELLEAFILGIVQGLTEFLPVSSSGHLELMKYILKDDSLAEQSMLTTVVLHFATAIATMVIFREDIIRIIKNLFSKGNKEDKSFVGFIIISMVPAAIVGICFEDLIDDFFYRNILLVAFMLLVTGVLLLIAEKLSTRDSNLANGKLTYSKSLIVGIAQAIAILPGISRSGSTIATSLIMGIDKQEAARFSFLMVVPLIFGKVAKDILSGDLVENMPSVPYLLIGFIAAFITGLFACKLMIKLVNNSKLRYFSYYCFLVGFTVIGYSYLV